MSVEVVACPVCGCSTLEPAPKVYRGEHDHGSLIVHFRSVPIYRVFEQETYLCASCNRQFVTDRQGREIDADLIAAMMSQRATQEQAKPAD